MQPADESAVVPLVTAIPASPPAAPGCDDQTLPARVASGDRAAAEALVRRHQAAVRGFLRSVCYDRSAIDDLAQETFLRAFKYADRFDPQYPLRGWLLTIARRLSINHGDKAKRRRPAPGIEPDHLTHRAQQTPDHQLEREEHHELTRRMVQTAMQKLSEPQRAAIAMHYQQGLALEHIAGLLEMPIGTVKSHLHRGRKRMKQLLEPQAERLQP